MNINSLYELYETINNYDNIHNMNEYRACDIAEYLNSYNGNDWIEYMNIYNKVFYNVNNKETENRIRLDSLSNDIFEMVIVQWPESIVKNTFDHSNKISIMKILYGSLIETLYDYSFVILNKEIIQKDKVSLVYKHIGSHDIRSTNHAVSLHIEFS
jgi:hypothetical protein